MTLDTAEAQVALETTGSIEIAPIAHFRLADYIQLGTMIGKNRVTYVGPNFLKHFGAVEETDIPAVTLRHYTLGRWDMDGPISDTLGVAGDEDPALAHMIEVLKLGEAGPGLFNGYSNTHYKRSPVDGRLWTPHWYMRGDRLGFGALPHGDEVGWEIGDRFYRVAD